MVFDVNRNDAVVCHEGSAGSVLERLASGEPKEEPVK